VPPPPASSLDLGPVELRLYPVCVLAGFVIWMLMTARIWERGGGDPVDAMWVCILAGPMALVGARFYSAGTDALQGIHSPPLDFSSGGLGIYGAILAGFAALVVSARVRGWPVGTFLDCAVPGLALGQAVGRFGNYFNQELFGGPTSLPWGLHVDPAYRPLDYLDESTFHPVFAYEAVWDVTVFFILIRIWPQLWERFRPGSVAAAYVALYAAGRLAIEAVRIDDTPKLAGVRFNQIVSLFAIATALLVLAMLDRKRRPR
jgi:prolipoprotein diacylglyceryl transferase